MARAKLGLAPGLRKFIAARGQLSLDLEAIERKAYDCGMYVTAHAINRAKNAAGWEMAGDITQAGKAARGEEYEPKARRLSKAGQRKADAIRLRIANDHKNATRRR